MKPLGRLILIAGMISLSGCGGGGGGGSDGSAGSGISTGSRVLRAEPATVQEALDNLTETGKRGTASRALPRRHGWPRNPHRIS